MLGCEDNGVYKVLLLNNNKILKSNHITFDESSYPGLDKSDSSSSRKEQRGSDSESDLLISSDASDTESIQV